MENIERGIEQSFLKSLMPQKVLLLLGARRTGKTSFIKKIIRQTKEPTLLLNGEDMDTIAAFNKRSMANYKRLIGKNKLLIIDEAQKIPDIGSKLKLMVDEIAGLKIIATGSSVFDLSNKLGEPLTGRSITFHLFPFAQSELQKYESALQTTAHLEERLIYGCYPELWQYPGNKEKANYLKELVNTYLLKDILAFEGIRNSSKIIELLRLIAFQAGNEVSLHELSQQLGITRATVERYLDLLTKVFIIFRVSAYSRNHRKEISKSSKWYFFDNGIRNTIIANMNDLSLRSDTGALWENYVISERLKYQSYTNMLVNNYFWRTYQQQEIDWIEERGGKLFAHEIKWNPKKNIKVPRAWKESYPKSEFAAITSDNYLDWIT